MARTISAGLPSSRLMAAALNSLFRSCCSAASLAPSFTEQTPAFVRATSMCPMAVRTIVKKTVAPSPPRR